METITQTNRTILFTEINPERLNLITLIGDVRGKTSLDDDKIKEINEELLVSSFDEFLDKFSPVVYSWCDATSASIQYSLEKPGEPAGKLHHGNSTDPFQRPLKYADHPGGRQGEPREWPTWILSSATC